MYTARFSPTLLRAPGSFTPQEKNTENRIMRYKNKKQKTKKKKLRKKRGSVTRKERTPVLFTGFKAHCNDDKEKEEEKQGRTRCKKEQQQRRVRSEGKNNKHSSTYSRAAHGISKETQFPSGNRDMYIMLANMKYDIFICLCHNWC
jgi:hypothetical protein